MVLLPHKMLPVYVLHARSTDSKTLMVFVNLQVIRVPQLVAHYASKTFQFLHYGYSQ